jgi:hypothetical protein
MQPAALHSGNGFGGGGGGASPRPDSPMVGMGNYHGGNGGSASRMSSAGSTGEGGAQRLRTPRISGRGCTHSQEVSDWLHGRPELNLWVALTPGGCQIGYMDHQTGCRKLNRVLTAK